MADRRDAGDELAFDKRKAVLTGLLAAALAAGAFGALGNFAHWPRLLHGIEHADQYWIPVGLLGEVLAYAGYVLAYRDIARVDGGPRLRYWTVIRVVGIGFGAFVVGSGFGTLAVDFWALHRAGDEALQAARRVLALNTLEWLWLGAFAAVAGAVALALRQGDAPLAMSLAWLTVVPLCVLAGLWVSAPGRGDRFVGLAEQEQRDHHGWRQGIVRWAGERAKLAFGEAVGGLQIVRHVLSHPHRFPFGGFGFTVYWLGDLLTLYAGVRAFGPHIAPELLVLAYASAYVITGLPLPAGGAGGVDASLALTLHVAGVPLANALLAVAFYRVFSFWLPIAPAVALLPTIPSVRDDLQALAGRSS